MDHSNDYYIAYCHWHPKILELHHKSKLILPETMFPKTVSFEMGKELCFHKFDGVQGAKGSPITRFYNFPSATDGFYCSYLATTVIDTNITQIASGAVTTINSLRDTLSTPLLRRNTESGSLGRQLSVRKVL